ncbi:MAG TPA: hypothetical protein VLS44_00395, partial [Nitrospira sp.]|nr:hypothetical protein [Nitrospira sp.]
VVFRISKGHAGKIHGGNCGVKIHGDGNGQGETLHPGDRATSGTDHSILIISTTWMYQRPVNGAGIGWSLSYKTMLRNIQTVDFSNGMCREFDAEASENVQPEGSAVQECSGVMGNIIPDRPVHPAGRPATV